MFLPRTSILLGNYNHSTVHRCILCRYTVISSSAPLIHHPTTHGLVPSCNPMRIRHGRLPDEWRYNEPPYRQRWAAEDPLPRGSFKPPFFYLIALIAQLPTLIPPCIDQHSITSVTVAVLTFMRPSGIRNSAIQYLTPTQRHGQPPRRTDHTNSEGQVGDSRQHGPSILLSIHSSYIEVFF